ncbi:MAG: bifunctional acetate--CoA ligase family protein/GNAT family N-acetyltransferase [Gammaproteobacteria bacterium]|nr:bifunctional acetate--CoA ligase family protein/GNAT family N-acetyltransferase [Gammaproteobacteria bacterium]
MGTHFLDRLFAPKAIAVFGASERAESVGARVFDNLLKGGFSHPVYAINPKYKRLRRQTCYPSIAAINKPVDLAIITTPAAGVAEIIHACGEHGVRAAIIISAGFSEGDGQGLALEKAVLDAARQYQMRILGPNCLGLIRPLDGMNATFSKNTANPGHLALVSQSGALCTSILDWAIAHDIGFSAIVSLGDAADVDFGDVLDYLAQDPETHSILLYVEGVRDARWFMSGLRIAARMKPVVVIKAGRHEEGSRAATTHTGALIGADDVFDAALQRAGAVRAMTIEQLFSAAQLLASRQRVSSNRLAIITNGGGLGVMATDRAIDLGVTIASLSADTLTQLNKHLPAHWSHANPVDLIGDASAERYRRAVKACLDDPAVDGVLVMLSPQAMTDTVACAQAVIDAQKNSKKPVLACWMGEQQVEAANRLFSKHRLPYFPNPESSVEAFAYLASYYQNQQLLMQVPSPLASRSEPDIDGARLIVESVLAENRTVLSIVESKALLHAFFIPVTQSIKCYSANDALVAAESLTFPVAMKINSPDISHKTDVGGVRLNIDSAHAIRNTYHELVDTVQDKYPAAKIEGVTIEQMYTPPNGRELLIGVIRDPVFGPTITFGAGGIQVEVLRDRAVALPPLNRFLAEQMIRQTHVARLLGKFRNMPAVNMDALVQVLRRVSEMVCELPEIRALDINPLVSDDQGVMALDARIVVERPAPSLDRYAHMAIHPYPSYLVSQLQLADGTNIKIRPIRPEDASIEQNFIRELSAQSRYFRFMQGINELTQQMLVRFTQLDYNRELALIAVLEDADGETELGVARYVMNPDGESCEFALVVADRWQHKGIGTQLMNALIDAARQRGFRIMDGEILANNRNMLMLTEKLGFKAQTSAEDPGIRVVSKIL